MGGNSIDSLRIKWMLVIAVGATLILRYIVGLSVPSQYQPVLPIGDMNCNNRIDTGDATLVLRDIVGLSIPKCWE